MSSNCNHRIQNLDYIHLHPLYSYVLLRTYFQHLCCLMFLTFFQLIGIMSCLKTWWHVTWVFSLFFFSVVAVVNVMPSLNLPTIFMRFLGSCLKLSNKLCPLQIVLGYLFASWMKLFSVLSMSLPYQCLSAPWKKHVARYRSFAVACILDFACLCLSHIQPKCPFLLTWSYLGLDQFHHQNTKWHLHNSWRTQVIHLVWPSNPVQLYQNTCVHYLVHMVKTRLCHSRTWLAWHIE